MTPISPYRTHRTFIDPPDSDASVLEGDVIECLSPLASTSQIQPVNQRSRHGAAPFLSGFMLLASRSARRFVGTILLRRDGASVPNRQDAHTGVLYCASLTSITLPSSFSSTTMLEPSAIGLVFTSIRSSGNTFSPSGVESLTWFLFGPVRINLPKIRRWVPAL